MIRRTFLKCLGLVPVAIAMPKVVLAEGAKTNIKGFAASALLAGGGSWVAFGATRQDCIDAINELAEDNHVISSSVIRIGD